MAYEKPVMEVLRLEEEDIICASGWSFTNQGDELSPIGG